MPNAWQALGKGLLSPLRFSPLQMKTISWWRTALCVVHTSGHLSRWDLLKGCVRGLALAG